MGRSCRTIGAGTLCCAGLCCPGMLAQAPGPEFEVASVRLAGSMSPGAVPGVVTGGPGTSDPTRIRYHDVPFVQLVMLAYGLNTEAGFVNDGLITPAGWMRANQYELVANIAPGATSAQVRVMLQKLLADRFALRVHREIQKFGGWEVTIAKDGPKLQANRNPNLTRLPLVPNAPAGQDHFPEVPEGSAGLAWSYQDGQVYLTGIGQSVSDLLGFSIFRYYHVVDKTGLSGQYDFHLSYRSGDLQDIYNTMEKQLGLKVRSADVTIDVLVIDSAKEKPAEN
jgi:uncharacterized protein (TIGR03435 family)